MRIYTLILGFKGYLPLFALLPLTRIIFEMSNVLLEYEIVWLKKKNKIIIQFYYHKKGQQQVCNPVPFGPKIKSLHRAL